MQSQRYSCAFPNKTALTGTFQYSELERKPFVPRATERPIMGLTSNKNYITANAVEAILQGAHDSCSAP